MSRSPGARSHGWRSWRLAAALAWGGLAWSVAAGVLIWVLPQGSSVTATSDGGVTTGPGESFSSMSGLGPVPLLIPVALAGLAAWAVLRRRRAVLIGATVVLAVYALLTGFSIGLAYVPAVVALVVACISSAARQDPGERED